MTGDILVINLASEVPPEVDLSGFKLTISLIALCKVDLRKSSLVKNGSALQKKSNS